MIDLFIFVFRIAALFFLSVKLAASPFYVMNGEIGKRAGMFAMANVVLGQLYRYECQENTILGGFEVDFMRNGLYYDPNAGSNWWSYYFEPICIGMKDLAKNEPMPKREYFEAVKRRTTLTRQQASHLVKKYVHVKPYILERVEAFIEENFKEYYIIGVHYRGTDKLQEAPRVAYGKVFESIHNHIPVGRPYKIFVATDEEPFLETAKQLFPNQILSIQAQRSKGNVNIHFKSPAPFQLGMEALTDALLLSKCDILIRTSSGLSLWSTYFNPDIPTILLNKKYTRTLEPE